MANIDMLTGQMPKPSISSQRITFAADTIDDELAEEVTSSWYMGNITVADSPVTIDGPGTKTSEGEWYFDVTGDISGWTSETDRIMFKRGSSLNNHTTTASARSAMDGLTDRMLIGYYDTNDNPNWDGNQTNLTNSAYNHWGILPDCAVTFEVAANTSFYNFEGDCSAVTAGLTIKNITSVSPNRGTFDYDPTAGLNATGTITIERVKCIGGSNGIFIDAAATANLVEVKSCYFENQTNFALDTNSAAKVYNCTFVGTENQWSNAATTITNNMFIHTRTSLGGSLISTNNIDTTGNHGTVKTMAELELWYTESLSGYPRIFWPAKATSDALGFGTNCPATRDIHGNEFVSGSYPAGCSLQFTFSEAGGVSLGAFENGAWR